MAQIVTPHFGVVDYDDNSVIRFPEGIPAFDADTAFVLIERAESAPVLFLQSLVHPELCFYTIPAPLLVPGFTLRAPPADLEALGGDGPELLALVLLTVRQEAPPTANLMAPVVVHRRTRLGRQIIQYDSEYSFEHPIVPAQEVAC